MILQIEFYQWELINLGENKACNKTFELYGKKVLIRL